MAIVSVDAGQVDGTKIAVADMIRRLSPHHWDAKFHTLDFSRRPQAEGFCTAFANGVGAHRLSWSASFSPQ